MSRASQHPTERDRPGLNMALAALERRQNIYPGADSIPRLLLEQIGNEGAVQEQSYDALLAERDQLRAELEAIRGQQAVAFAVFADNGNIRIWSANSSATRAELIAQGAAITDLYALPPQQPDAVSVPRELLDVGHLIRTQDNRCTDAPLFVVMKKRPIVASPDHDYDYIEWVNVDNDYAVASEVRARRLEALYEGCRDIPEGWERFAMKEIDVFVTACFTEQGCKDFLARDGHNHRKPFIYAFGSYRNAEFRAVRDWLAALPSAKNAE